MPEPWNIALWGPSAAGKTVFLAQLLRRSAIFEADWEILPTEQASRFLEIVGSMMDLNRFPSATAVTEAISKVEYSFRNKVNGGVASLVIEDRAGAESVELTEEGKQRFNDAHGLILLFDPDRVRWSLESDIERTLRKLAVAANRGTNRDERPIAICLTKADQLIETAEDLRRAIETPREFVFEKITDELAGWLAKYCTNYEFFPISSVGVRLRHGVVEQCVFRDELLELRLGSEGSPLNLVAPFGWLIDRISRGRK